MTAGQSADPNSPLHDTNKAHYWTLTESLRTYNYTYEHKVMAVYILSTFISEDVTYADTVHKAHGTEMLGNG